MSHQGSEAQLLGVGTSGLERLPSRAGNVGSYGTQAGHPRTFGMHVDKRHAYDLAVVAHGRVSVVRPAETAAGKKNGSPVLLLYHTESGITVV